MIVKILSSSTTFSGVHYNEDKIAKGTAELLASENFGLLHQGASGIADMDYKGYLQTWSRGDNNRQAVKHPQFHAVISCEGRAYHAYELQDMAEQYLEKLGYSQNPYLIYFHSDTANNHVHIVSSRVNQEGKKIDDSFERTRSQKAIKEILHQDMRQEISGHVRESMAYDFSTPAQFRLLLEGRGVKVEEALGDYRFIKYGRIVGALPTEEVAEKAAGYTPPEGRIRQLRAMLNKYKPGLEQHEFLTLLSKKFGVEVVFHQAPGKDTPYGYTLIDHAKKQVFKGSQVMKLGELLNGTGPVSPEQRQAQRTEQARQWTITSLKEARILQRLFHLKPDALQVNSPQDKEAREYVGEKLNSLLANGKPLADILQSNGWSMARLDGQHYLIDRREKAIHPMDELTTRRLDYGSEQRLDLDREVGPQATQRMEHSSGSITELLQLIAQGLQEGSQPAQQERKNKRRLKR